MDVPRSLVRDVVNASAPNAHPAMQRLQEFRNVATISDRVRQILADAGIDLDPPSENPLSPYHWRNLQMVVRAAASPVRMPP